MNENYLTHFNSFFCSFFNKENLLSTRSQSFPIQLRITLTAILVLKIASNFDIHGTLSVRYRVYPTNIIKQSNKTKRAVYTNCKYNFLMLMRLKPFLDSPP